MNLQLSEEQQLLESTLQRVCRENSSSKQIRASEPLGFDKELWKLLVEQGVPMLRVPEAHGGSGASLMHAVIAAEQTGRSLASAPVIESIVANRLLAMLEKHDPKLLSACASGAALTTIALHDISGAGRQLVPAGAIADVVICINRDEVELHSDLHRLPLTEDVEGRTLHGAIPAQWIDLRKSGNIVNIVGGLDAFHSAREEWKLLTAAMLSSIALQAIENAAKYAGEREAFGRKIGEYQGVSHALADAFTDADSGRTLVWRTVDAIARNEDGAGAMVSMAYWWSASIAGPATLKAMRIFGGYGMTMEYDAQLFFRRANSHRLVAGNPDLELARVYSRLFDGEKAFLPDAGDVCIDFDLGPEWESAERKMLNFCEKRDTQSLKRFMRDSLDGFDLGLNKALAKDGLLYPEMPKMYGGHAMSGRSTAAIREVWAKLGWHMSVANVTDLVWKIIWHFGSDQVKSDVLPRIAAGDAYCSLGYSEPSGGSDIFAAKTTATRDGDHWLINGQKMFTSQGHVADYSLMIARTGPDKYKGLTLFLVPVKQAGYQVSQIKTVGDERTNVTFYSNVRVPDAYRIGDVNGGVKMLVAALVMEQSDGAVYIAALKNLLRDGLQWARSPHADGRTPIDDPAVQRELAEIAVRMHLVESISRRCIWSFENKQGRKHEGPVIKLLGTESWLRCSQNLLQVAAPDTLARGYNGAGAIEWSSRRCIAATIYAGTSEVQRSLIAEAGLGLPRTR